MVKATKLLLLSVLVLLNTSCSASDNNLETSADKSLDKDYLNVAERQHSLSVASQKQLLSEMIFVEGGSFKWVVIMPVQENEKC
jgi:hypothetical protein